MRLFPGALIHFYAKIFFPTLCQSETQHASECISMHQGASIRPTIHQHASSSSSSSNVVSIGICGGASGWSLLCVSKRGPSPGSQAIRVLLCIVIYLGRQCRCRMSPEMEGRTWCFLYKTGRGHHCSCFGSRTWKSGVHEAADFTSRFRQKIQNKQTQNDYQKAFSIYTARQNIKDPFKALLIRWKRPSRNRCGLSSRHSKMGFYQQIINRPQWFWGHLNKLIQRWLLLLGIMISGSSFMWIMRAIYTSNTLCWSHFISADTWDIFPLSEHSVVWYSSYFHHLKTKQNNKTIEALQIIITEKTGKHPESENIWNVV